MEPDLLIWNLIASATISIILLFVYLVVMIFAMQFFLVLIKEKPNPFLWAFLVSPMFVFMVSPVLGALYLITGIPLFFLILIIQASKWGRAREFKILFCCAAAASIGFGIPAAYGQEYQRARYIAAVRGHPLPEDVTPIPQFDPAAGIPYRNAGSIQEFEFVANDTFNIRIPVIRGLIFESTQHQEDFISFTMADPTSKYRYNSFWGSIRVANRAIEDPTMRTYIEEQYACFDKSNVLFESRSRLRRADVQRQRETLYVTRNAAAIFQVRGGLKLSLSQIYEVTGIVGTADDAVYEFSFTGSAFEKTESLTIRNIISDWAYAFIEANRAPSPPPAAADAPAALPAP